MQPQFLPLKKNIGLYCEIGGELLTEKNCTKALTSAACDEHFAESQEINRKVRAAGIHDAPYLSCIDRLQFDEKTGRRTHIFYQEMSPRAKHALRDMGVHFSDNVIYATKGVEQIEGAIYKYEDIVLVERDGNIDIK